jgi:hypothetical protein
MRSVRRAPFLHAVAVLAGLVTGVSAPAADKQVQKPDPTKAPDRLLSVDAKLSAEQLARRIDRAVEEKIRAEKVELSPLTRDAEFLRRVYLDLTGKIPTPAKAASFLDSKESAKRGKLIDELLASKEFGAHMADLWQALLLPRNTETRRMLSLFPHLVSWMSEQFNSNTGWNKIARDILTSSGKVNKSGPTIYWLANGTADKATDNVTRMFMGIQLQCAQCHNHPFTEYKRDEYWRMAAFFLKVQPDGNPRQALRNGGDITVSEVNGRPNRRRRLPESAKILSAKFLGGDAPKLRASDPARPVFADWLTSPKNPFFARAMVNRTWGQLFGRGIIQPVDDMHDAQANSHPELLAELSRQFAANGFDVKYLVRAICNSDAYQRSSRPAGNNDEAGPELFARMAIKPLTPGQLYDSISQVMGGMAPLRGGARAGAGAGRFGGTPREAFITSFGIEDGADPTEFQAGIPQVLRLMNAPQLNRATAIAALLREGKGQADIVEGLYLKALSRRPTSEDLDLVNRYMQKNRGDSRQAYAGVLWALVNSSEFALNR